MTEKLFMRLPCGEQNFASLRTENYAYVDKTQYVEMLENEHSKYHFFVRPRKFGKSLFVSMLSYYYDMLCADRFLELFGGLYIGDNPTPLKNSYAIMKFDFSGLDTSSPEMLTKSFEQNVNRTVIDFLGKYSSVFPKASELIARIKSHQEGIGSLYTAYGAAMEANVKIFVIIDEYDHFANDLIAMGVDDDYNQMIQASRLVRAFYETLKIGAKSVVDRIFITGISPVMLDNLTSGFNIAVILSMAERYNNMMGFTREEVEWLMDETGVDRDCINVDMEWYYNGYLFHKDATDRLYNPSMMLYFFSQIINERKVPESIIDPNLKTDYGRLQRLMQNEDNRDVLLQIVKDGGIVTAIQTAFHFDVLYDKNHFVSLLFYMGLLTIEKPGFGNFVRLCIPNYSIQTVFWEYIPKIVQERLAFTIDTAELDLSVQALALDGQAKPFIEYISRNIFRKLSKRDLRQFDEKYIKIMMLTSLFQSATYIPESETETDNGYIGVFLHRSPQMPEVKHEWIFEFKYLKASVKNIESYRLEAQAQLQAYSALPRMKESKNLKKAVILFVGKNKYKLYERGDTS